MTVQEFIADPAAALHAIRTSYGIQDVANALVSLSPTTTSWITDPYEALNTLRTSHDVAAVTQAASFFASSTAATITSGMAALNTLRTSSVAADVGGVVAALLALGGWSGGGGGPQFTYTLDGGNATITGTANGITLSGSISIPSTVDGHPVVAIGVAAFQSYTALTSITIPGSVTSIGDYAFLACAALTSITIPDSVTSIGNCAFLACAALASITIPDSVTSIGASAFYGCGGLTSVTLGSGVTSIGNFAFYGCTSLASATFQGTSAPSMGSGVFEGDSSLTIHVPSGATGYDVSPWTGWTVVTALAFTYNILLDGGAAITGYTGTLPPFLVIPPTIDGHPVTAIWDAAFTYTALIGLTLPDSVTAINGGAFEACPNLASITWGSGLTAIGVSVFNGCTSLVGIVIPAGVTFINAQAFYGCTSLASVTFLGTTAPSLNMEDSSSVFGDVGSGFTIHVPSGATGYDVSPWTGWTVVSP